MNIGVSATATVVALLLSIVDVHAQTDFYAGRQITLLIGTTPGGGYDAYGRLLARHIGRHIPGKPAVIAKNMPGAGGVALANHLYNRAPKDGTEIGIVGRGVAMESKKDDKGVLKAVLKDTAERDWQDPYHQECAMKW